MKQAELESHGDLNLNDLKDLMRLSKDSSEMSSAKDHAYTSVKDQHLLGQIDLKDMMKDFKKDFDISELDLSSQGTVPENAIDINYNQLEKQKTS